MVEWCRAGESIYKCSERMMLRKISKGRGRDWYKRHVLRIAPVLLGVLMIVANPSQGSAQFGFEPQVELLKDLGVSEMEEEIHFTNDEGENKNYIASQKIINKHGYIEQQTDFGTEGIVTFKTDNRYEMDTILVERVSSYPYTNPPFSYVERHFINKQGRRKKTTFSRDGVMTTEMKYSYTKEGKLKCIKTKLIGNKKFRSRSGKIVNKHSYDANGRLIGREKKQKFKGEKSKEYYEWEYKEEGTLEEAYKILSEKGSRQLTTRKKYNNQQKLIFEERHYSRKMSFPVAGKIRKFDIGDVSRDEYTYLDNGLMGQVKMYKNGVLLGTRFYSYSY